MSRKPSDIRSTACCVRCGAPVRAGVTYCTRCGAKLPDAGHVHPQAAVTGQSAAVTGQSQAAGSMRNKPVGDVGDELVREVRNPDPSRTRTRARRTARPQARPAKAKNKRNKKIIVVAAFVAAGLAAAACFFIYEMRSGTDLSDISGTWQPINSRDGEMTIQGDSIRLTPDMEEKKIEESSSGFIVTDTIMGVTEELSFTIDDNGFLWKTSAFSEVERTGGYTMAEAFYREGETSDKVEYASAHFGTGEDAEGSYEEFLTGTWSSGRHWITIGRSEDGTVSVDHDLPAIDGKMDYDETDDGVFCSSDGFYIWTKGTFLISMIPIGDDTCAAFMYGDGTTGTFTRKQ